MEEMHVKAGAMESKKVPVVTIVLVVLLVATLVTGAFLLIWNLQQKGEMKSLNEQLVEKEATIAELRGDETVAEGEAEEIAESGEVVKTNKYLYVGEWGLKFKIPAGLVAMEYIFEIKGAPTLCVSGVKVGGQYAPEFADITKNTLGCVSQMVKGAERIGGAVVYSDDQYEYVYYHPQAVYTPATDKEEQQWEVDSTALVQELLTQDVTRF